LSKSENILIAPLNWGLGHAVRCIPIIQQLQSEEHRIIIASDGDALHFLQKEFPGLTFEELPGYHITYARKSFWNKWHLLRQLPQIIKTMQAERKATDLLVEKYRINRIISDNRFGVYSKKIPSVYITHQLRVLSGVTTYLTTYFHRKIYQKYDEIWVPDREASPNLSGKLGHLDKNPENVSYIGALTRMQKKEIDKQYDILVILSGPEPQRSLLERKLLKIFQELPYKTALIQGKTGAEQTLTKLGNVSVYNYVLTGEMERLINASKVIISRSGYTSVMDLVSLQKKVIWVPTPGQTEQKYLAKHLANNYGHIFYKQSELHFDHITRAIEILRH